MFDRPAFPTSGSTYFERYGRATAGIAVTLLCLALLGVITLVPRPVLADSHVLYVNHSAAGANNGSSWADAYTDLQAALQAATSGQEIWVAAGVYKPGTTRSATFQLKDGVALYGGFAGTETQRDQRDWQTHETILSGDIGVAGDATDNSYHVVSGSGISNTAILDGFTITGGNASGSNSDSSGGGMYNDNGSPTLVNVTFSDNSAHNGGGMYNWQSHPTLRNVTFDGNSAGTGGGGMLNAASHPTLVNVTFSGNSAYYYGGGMYNGSSSPTLVNVTFNGNSAALSGGGMHNLDGSSPTLVNVTFNDNSADDGGGMLNYNGSNPSLKNVTFSSNSADHYGGGMFNGSSSPTLVNITFSDNSAHHGGGMGNQASNPILVNVTFNGNSADDYGGGMFNETSYPTLVNVTFSGNSAHSGGGMRNYNGSSPTLVNVTLSGNSAHSGGGMENYDGSHPTLNNCIVWGNRDHRGTGQSAQIFNRQSIASVSYSLVQGGVYTGTGNITGDPLLVDPVDPADAPTTSGDLRLRPDSPALDVGSNDLVPADTLDLDEDGDTAEPLPYDLNGNPRFEDHPDAGAATGVIVDLGAYERYAEEPGEPEPTLFLPLLLR